MIVYPGAPGMAHPIHTGGPVDRYGGGLPAGPQTGGTGLAQAILAGAAKTRPVNPANRSATGGLHALLAAAAQRAMEQQAQMKGSYGTGNATVLRALQQQSANLHAAGS